MGPSAERSLLFARPSPINVPDGARVPDGSRVPDGARIPADSREPHDHTVPDVDSIAVDGDLFLLDRLLAEDGVHSVYQPIVELESGAVVGYEALARGPRDHVLESPDLLFDAARRGRRLPELDGACRNAALTGARTGGLDAPWTLFVNVEPETAGDAFLAPTDPAAEEAVAVTDGGDGLRIVVELTERALVADPTELLLLVSRIRARGWGIALDDVGAERASLALLPLLRPDVIKLDLRLVQDGATAEIAEIVSAVNAEAERSGTVILAEGVESEEHLNIALSLGATLGQGWLLGRPGPLPDPLPTFVGSPLRIVDRAVVDLRAGLFGSAAARRTPRAARKPLLVEMSKHLERQAMVAGESTMVLSTFQNVAYFTPATRRRYAELVAHTAFVGALGEGMARAPMPGVRGGALRPSDPLLGEWDIGVIGPHFAAALVARDLGDSGPDGERRFEFVLSYDRELAIEVATSLMSRIWADA